MENKRTRGNFNVMCRLVGLVKPLAPVMVCAVLLGVAGFLCAIFIPVLGVYALLDSLLDAAPIALGTVCILLPILAVARGVLHYAEQGCNHFIAFKLLALIRDKVFGVLRRLAPAKLEGRDKGDLIAVLTADIELLEVFYAHTISPICIAVIVSIVMACFMGSYAPALGLYAALSYAVIGIGVPVAAALPRICWDREWPALEQGLKKLQKLGVDQALCPTWDAVERALQLGLRARGDFGLNIFNSQALKQLRQMGLESAVVSFELKLPQIRDLSKAVDTEFIAYGRLPLMITENCIIHNQFGKHVCANSNVLTDRKGVRFPVVKAWGCRNEIFNANKLFLADKAGDWARLGLWALRLSFTTENGLECAQVLERYRGEGAYTPTDYTRGLYYRDVE